MAMEVEDTRLGEKGVLVHGGLRGRAGAERRTTRGNRIEHRATCASLAERPPAGRDVVVLHQRQRHPPSIGKVQAATALARQKAERLNFQADFDGELQVDAALVPEIADRKCADSKVAGKANVLIFPDLNSGNIASKLVRLVGHANAYGNILLGLDRPAADVSRGSNAHDILGVAAIVGAQAVSYHELFPGSGKNLPGE
jgi:phosphate acetyltransferase